MNNAIAIGPVRLLLIDSDPRTQELIAGVFQPNDLQLLTAATSEQGIEQSKKTMPDIVLIDYGISENGGIQVLEQLRAAGVPERIPVVFLSGEDRPEVVIDCFDAGAADFIRKPICRAELSARINSVLDRIRIRLELERQALVDPLTQLLNRTSILARIQAAIDRVQASKSAVLFLDFDRFKLINDSLGHDVGDRLLRQIANRLTGTLRCKNTVTHPSETAVVARLGGDEFVVLIEGLDDPEDAHWFAKRLLKSLEAPYSLHGRRVCSTASIGVVGDLCGYQTPNEVLRDADTAMYEAKAEGRGRYVMFDPLMHIHADERLRLDNDLRYAIANDELFLVYQPIISLETGRTDGFESLIRWRHSRRGVISPAVFLPLAEESGLIVAIGDWVLDQACQEFASWKRLFGRNAPSQIHVNVSRQQLLYDFVRRVKNSLEKYSVEPQALHLEVTESTIMQSPDQAKATLVELRQLGVKIEMDDFGTGYSSLSCLLDLPIDVLKIDQSFVANMNRSRNFTAMVQAVIMMGQNLGLKIIAEGIETEEQLSMLQSMDCDFGQGYYFERPMTAENARSNLRRLLPQSGAHSISPPHDSARTQSSLDLTCHQ